MRSASEEGEQHPAGGSLANSPRNMSRHPAGPHAGNFPRLNSNRALTAIRSSPRARSGLIRGATSWVRTSVANLGLRDLAMLNRGEARAHYRDDLADELLCLLTHPNGASGFSALESRRPGPAVRERVRLRGVPFLGTTKRSLSEPPKKGRRCPSESLSCGYCRLVGRLNRQVRVQPEPAQRRV